ncbi:MAG: hypothetical protein PHI55_05500 [Burkholderiaceae bacterium]|nr:hypothetical protein [Burkholderiaceae bacterium]
MLLFRILALFLATAAAVLLGFYAVTGQAHYKRWGLVIVKWTVIAALVFFAVLFLERLA